MAIDCFISFAEERPEKSTASVPKGNPRTPWKDRAEIQAWSFGVKSPYDSVAALPPGQRRHFPITIRKEIDKSTPLLFKAFVSKEPLWCKVDLFKASTGGVRLRPNFSAELSGGVISSIRHVTATQGQTHSGIRHTSELEEIQFTFEKIDVTWNDGGITMQDDWNAPV